MHFLILLFLILQVKEIQEVWHYERRKSGLFAEYMNTFLKIKTESSGRPEGVETDEQLQQFIEDFEHHEGVKLDPTKIQKNPGLRLLAKLCLNSLWGRLGMKENKSRTEYVNTAERFYELLLSGQYNVTGFEPFNDDVMGVQYKLEDEFVETNATVNVVIAA